MAHSFGPFRRLLRSFGASPRDSVTFDGDIRPEDIPMDKELLSTLQALRSIRLTHTERDRMLTTILGAPAPAGWLFSLRQVAALSFAVALLLGSGISYAAESALPGQVLYTVKVHMNERVRGSLARSSRSRAHWQVRLAERRLEEGEALAARGHLTTEIRESIRVRFRDHAQQVALHLDSLLSAEQMETAAEVSADFEAALHAHETVIARIERAQGRVNSAGSLLSDVRSFLQAAKEARFIAQARSTTRADAGLPGATKSTIAAANERIRNARAILRERATEHPQLAREADIKLTVAERDIEEAEDFLGEEDIAPDILEQVSSALSAAEEVSLLLKHAERGGATITAMPQDAGLSIGNGARLHAEARINVAGKRIADTSKLLELTKKHRTEEETRRAQEELKKAEEALTDAQRQLQAQAYDQAVAAADGAIVHAKKARRIIRREPEEKEGS